MGMTMVLAESAELFPVKTSHAADLRAAAWYLVRRMEDQPKGATPDARFHKLLMKYSQIMRALVCLENTPADYAYLESEDRALVTRVCAWLENHPDERAHAL